MGAVTPNYDTCDLSRFPSRLTSGSIRLVAVGRGGPQGPPYPPRADCSARDGWAAWCGPDDKEDTITEHQGSPPKGLPSEGSARLREALAAGLLTPEEYQERCELTANAVSAARTVPMAAFRPLSRSEQRAADEAARKATLARTHAVKVAEAPKLIGMPKSRVSVPFVPAPAVQGPLTGMPGGGAVAEKVTTDPKIAAIRDRFLDGQIDLTEAKRLMAEAKFKPDAGSVPCPGCAPKVDGRPAFQDWNAPGPNCAVCNGKRRLVVSVQDRMVPMHEHRAAGTIGFTYQDHTGMISTGFANSGDAAVKAMVRMLGSSYYSHATIDSGVILTLHEHQVACSVCRKDARCGKCDNGIVHRSRTTRIHFRDEYRKDGSTLATFQDGGEKTGAELARRAALAAMSPEGLKRSIGMTCHRCKGVGCEGCKGGFVRITVRHWIPDKGAATVGTVIRRSDLMAEEKAPTADERLTPIGGKQTMTRPSTDPKWAMPKGWARHTKGGVKFNRNKYLGTNKV